MIFLPNKFDIYVAALRNLLQNLILKNGIKANYLTILQKLFEAEAKNEKYVSPVNITDEYTEILNAVNFKKAIHRLDFDFYINLSGNYILNKKQFTALILSLCTKNNYIKIYEQNRKTVISVKSRLDYKQRLFVKLLNGTVLSEIKSNRTFIIFNFSYTEKKAEDFESAYSLLQNPLSAVNFYL